MAVHELFIPDEEVMDMISERASLRKLRDIALKKGMVPLQLDGIEKVKAGIVSIDEILRTTQSDF